MLKLCSNNPYRPLQNSMKPHSMCSVSYWKQRKHGACGNINADLKSAGRKVVGVQVPLRAPTKQNTYKKNAARKREEFFVWCLFWCLLCQAVLVGCTRRSDAEAVTSGERWL